MARFLRLRMSPRAEATYSAPARMETATERFSVLMVGVWRDHIAYGRRLMITEVILRNQADVDSGSS
jgi:hypothetical protein